MTSFGYAYLIATAVVAATASSLGLVTSVPLTRVGLVRGGAARHVDASSWLALLAVGATAGLFAVSGAEVASAVLGDAYGDDVGTEIARLVVSMSPFMVVSVVLSVTFRSCSSRASGASCPSSASSSSPPVIPLALVAQRVAGLWGLALALAISTGFAVAWLLHLLKALEETVWLAGAVGAVFLVFLLAFVPAASSQRGSPSRRSAWCSRPRSSPSPGRRGSRRRGATSGSSRDLAGHRVVLSWNGTVETLACLRSLSV